MTIVWVWPPSPGPSVTMFVRSTPCVYKLKIRIVSNLGNKENTWAVNCCIASFRASSNSNPNSSTFSLTTASKVSWVITLTMANLNSYRFINFGKLINCRSEKHSKFLFLLRTEQGLVIVNKTVFEVGVCQNLFQNKNRQVSAPPRVKFVNCYDSLRQINKLPAIWQPHYRRQKTKLPSPRPQYVNVFRKKWLKKVVPHSYSCTVFYVQIKLSFFSTAFGNRMKGRYKKALPFIYYF